MSDDPHDPIEELFHGALALPKPRRAEYLEAGCGGDAALRKRLEALLLSAEDERTLDRPLLAELQGQDEVAIAEGPGSRIGRYKLLEVLGEGGFGVVYMAEQQEPVIRRVALKIIKLGMDTREVLARFEAERQALALMDHPNIARVLDGGTTDTGRPYFVMELVRGVAITEFCDSNRSGTRERLELFREVCRAVQHAHQKGVIHRDLKPSNVMVTLHDGRPVPKVIDFGVAKAMNARLTERTLFTRFQQFIGTPAYMSPEQAEMSGLDIDTRSDIYSLGVLLYELLTGSTPIDPRVLLQAGVAELQRVIREDEVERPSLRISTRGDAEVARTRRLDSQALSKHLRGDLDWIVLKALEKDRRRRYDSAGEMAEDVERHLSQLPVLASPPSTPYRLRKFVARNRGLVTTVSVVFVALLLGIVGTSLGLREASQQRDLAEERAERFQGLTDHLIGMLSLADPRLALRPEVSVRELLELSAEETREVFRGEPSAEARVLSAVGRAYLSLGEHELAEEHLARAIEAFEGLEVADGFEHYAALWARTNTAFKLERPDAFAWARRARDVGHAHLAERTHELARRLDAFHDPIEEAAHQADPELLEASAARIPGCLAEARRVLPSGDRRWAIVAETFMAAGYWTWYTPHEGFGVRYFEAALAIQESELAPGNPNRVESLALLCGMLNRLGRGEEATVRLRAAVRDLREVLGPENFQRAFIESMLGEGLARAGEYGAAAELLLPAHAVIESQVQNEGDFYLQDSFARVVAMYEAWGKTEEARAVRQDLAGRLIQSRYLSPWLIARRALGPEHEALALAMDRVHEVLAGALFSVDVGPREASSIEAELRAVLDRLRRELDARDPVACLVARELQGLQRGIGFAQQPALAQEVAEGVRSALGAWRGEVPLDYAAAAARCAEVLAQSGDAPGALERAREAAGVLEGARPEENWFAAVYQVHVARGLAASGQVQAARALLLRARRAFAQQLGESHVQTRAVGRVLAELDREH